MDIAEKIAQLQDALPYLAPEKLSMASEMVLAELEAMTPEDRLQYGPDIARLISAFETRILGLEQELKQGDTQA